MSRDRECKHSRAVWVCVSDAHLQNQATFPEPSSHADLHIEGVLLIFDRNHYAQCGRPIIHSKCAAFGN